MLPGFDGDIIIVNSILAPYLVYVIGDSPEYGLVVDRLIFLTIWVWLKTLANR